MENSEKKFIDFLNNNPASGHEYDNERFVEFVITSIKEGNTILTNEQRSILIKNYGDELCDFYINAYYWIRLTTEVLARSSNMN